MLVAHEAGYADRGRHGSPEVDVAGLPLFHSEGHVDVAFLVRPDRKRLVGRQRLEEAEPLNRLVARDDTLVTIHIAREQNEPVTYHTFMRVRVPGNVDQVHIGPWILLDPPLESHPRQPVLTLRQPLDYRVNLSVEETGVPIQLLDLFSGIPPRMGVEDGLAFII